MLKRHVLILPAFTAALGSCAAPVPGDAPSVAQGPADSCFSAAFITDYETIDERRIRVRAGVDERYDIFVSGGGCNMLEWTQRLAIETPATSHLCVGKTLGQGDLRFRDPVSRRQVTCHIDEIRPVPGTGRAG